MIQNMGRRFKTSSRQMLLLCGIVLGMASMAMQSCSEAARDDRPALCGNGRSSKRRGQAGLDYPES